MTIRVIKKIENMFQTEKRPSGYPTYEVMCSNCGKHFPMIKYDIGKTEYCQKCANTNREGVNMWKDKKIEHSGMKGTHFYKKWVNIKGRCNYPCVNGFKNYGGRGIKVERKSFLDFYNDMYPSYLDHVRKYGEENTTIDRIDTNGNYNKENCRWKTKLEQQSNKRNNHRVLYKGKEYPTMKGLCELMGKNYYKVFRRITTYGWSVEDAIDK